MSEEINKELIFLKKVAKTAVVTGVYIYRDKGGSVIICRKS